MERGRQDWIISLSFISVKSLAGWDVMVSKKNFTFPTIEEKVP